MVVVVLNMALSAEADHLASTLRGRGEGGQQVHAVWKLWVLSLGVVDEVDVGVGGRRCGDLDHVLVLLRLFAKDVDDVLLLRRRDDDWVRSLAGLRESHEDHIVLDGGFRDVLVMVDFRRDGRDVVQQHAAVDARSDTPACVEDLSGVARG